MNSLFIVFYTIIILAVVNWVRTTSVVYKDGVYHKYKSIALVPVESRASQLSSNQLTNFATKYMLKSKVHYGHYIYLNSLVSEYDLKVGRRFYCGDYTGWDGALISPAFFYHRDCVAIHWASSFSKCVLPSSCSDIRVLDSDNKFYKICMGRKVLPGSQPNVIKISYATNSNSVPKPDGFMAICHDDYIRYLPRSYYDYLTYAYLHYNISTLFADITLISFLDIESMISYLTKRVTGTFINHEYKFLCDNVLWGKGIRKIGNVLVFPARQYCVNYFTVNSTHAICQDLFESGDYRCPLDYYSHHSHKDVFIQSFQYAVSENNATPYNWIDYTFRAYERYWDPLISEFRIFALQLVNTITRAMVDSLKQISNNLEYIYRLMVDVNREGFSNKFYERQLNYTLKVVDYFILKLNSPVNQTFVNPVRNVEGWFGNLIAGALEVLIDPFVQALLSVFKEFWHFLQPILKLFIKELFEILITTLVTITPILEDFLKILVDDLDVILDLLLRLLHILLLLLFRVYIYLECRYYLTEYILLVVFLSRFYFWGNNVSSLLIMFIVMFFVGIQRVYPSILWELMSSEFKQNLTCPYNYSLGITHYGLKSVKLYYINGTIS